MRDAHEREYVEFVEGSLSRLRRIAYQFCGDADRADDLVQTALTTVYVKWKQVRAADNIDAYVRMILTRAFLSEWRRPWSRVRLAETLPDGAAPAADPVEDRLAIRADKKTPVVWHC